jgi:hypothetical protein
VIGVSAFSQIATLHSKQPRGRSGTSNIEQQKLGLIAFNAKHNPHSTTLPPTSYAVTTLPLSYPIFKSSFLPSLSRSRRWTSSLPLRLLRPAQDHGSHYPSASGTHFQHPRECSQKTHQRQPNTKGEGEGDTKRGRL